MKAKRITAFLLVTAIIISIILSFTGCSEASKVNQNLNTKAGYFECERRITTL